MGINVFSGCEETTPQNLIYETMSPLTSLDPQTLSGETNMQIAKAIKVTMLISIPAAVGLFVLVKNLHIKYMRILLMKL